MLGVLPHAWLRVEGFHIILFLHRPLCEVDIHVTRFVDEKTEAQKGSLSIYLDACNQGLGYAEPSTTLSSRGNQTDLAGNAGCL